MLSLSILCFLLSVSEAIPLHESTTNLLARDDVQGGFSLPIRRTKLAGSNLRKRKSLKKRQDVSGSTALGNNNDLLYTVPIKFGDKVAAVHLDTGSSDLWTITDQCATGSCSQLSPFTHAISSTGLNLTNTQVQMQYGDSQTGTSATGTVAMDTLTIAGIAITNQAFAAIRSTTNTVVQFGASGIFGLGFPSGSEVQEALVSAEAGAVVDTSAFVKSTWKYGPLLSRISMSHMLKEPMFSIELQRSTIDIDEESNGDLTVGKLPDDIDPSSVTWVPVKLYTPAEGGLKAPAFAPNETYPFRWEIDIDGVFLDGKPVANSRIPATGGVDNQRTTALIDTGNSLLRGPKDVVDNILSTVAPNYRSGVYTTATFPCEIPHRLEFKIAGKMFPIDPRDFIGQPTLGDVRTCVADNLVDTDAPGFGATFRWSLGDPFFKSNLVAFHYGNLTHPSVDPPRIGLVSRVPADADAKLAQAINDAKTNGGTFENTIQIAPTASAATAAQITVSDDPNAKATKTALPTGNNPAAGSPTNTPPPVATIEMNSPDGGSRKNGAAVTIPMQMPLFVAAVSVLLGAGHVLAW